MQSISIKRVLVGALASVMSEAVPLGKSLLGPALIYLTLNLIPGELMAGGLIFVLAVASLALHTIVAITTHRIVMLGPDSIPEWGIRSWSMRETRFAKYAALLILMFAMLISLAMVTQPIGPPLAMIAIVVAGSSLSLVFPAIAIEEDLSLGGAWRMSQGHLPQLIVCVSLFPLILGLTTLLLAMIPYASALAVIVQLVATVLTNAALSIAFSEIRRSRS